VADGVVHHLFDLAHPVFDFFVFGIDCVESFDEFFFAGEHTSNCFVGLEFEFDHVFEDFAEMGLDFFYIFGLGKDFEEIIIG